MANFKAVTVNGQYTDPAKIQAVLKAFGGFEKANSGVFSVVVTETDPASGKVVNTQMGVMVVPTEGGLD